MSGVRAFGAGREDHQGHGRGDGARPWHDDPREQEDHAREQHARAHRVDEERRLNLHRKAGGGVADDRRGHQEVGPVVVEGLTGPERDSAAGW